MRRRLANDRELVSRPILSCESIAFSRLNSTSRISVTGAPIATAEATSVDESELASTVSLALVEFFSVELDVGEERTVLTEPESLGEGAVDVSATVTAPDEDDVDRDDSDDGAVVATGAADVDAGAGELEVEEAAGAGDAAATVFPELVDAVEVSGAGAGVDAAGVDEDGAGTLVDATLSVVVAAGAGAGVTAFGVEVA